MYCFNTQPPEGGWVGMYRPMMAAMGVSTHSRLKAAGAAAGAADRETGSFNTQPPEGGWAKNGEQALVDFVSTHSRLKAAG